MKSLILCAALLALPLVCEAGGHCLNGQCNVQRVVIAPQRQQVFVQRQAVVVQRAVVAPARVNVNVGRGFFGRQRVNVNVR